MSFVQSAPANKTDFNNSQDYLDTRTDTILQPKTAEGISGFLFDIPDGENINLNSEITDHFTENNSFINDHIVRKPITITLNGFIGELVAKPPEGVFGDAQEIANRLTVIDGYIGEYTAGGAQIVQRAVQTVQSVVSGINQLADKAQNLIDLFDGETAEETKQQKAYRDLYALWKSATFVTVQTPWEYFGNMVIQNIAFRQNADSKSITDISVTLKELRIAEIQTVDYDQNQFPPRVQVQEGEEEDQGIIRGQDEDVSFLFTAFGADE